MLKVPRFWVGGFRHASSSSPRQGADRFFPELIHFEDSVLAFGHFDFLLSGQFLSQFALKTLINYSAMTAAAVAHLRYVGVVQSTRALWRRAVTLMHPCFIESDVLDRFPESMRLSAPAGCIGGRSSARFASRRVVVGVLSTPESKKAPDLYGCDAVAQTRGQQRRSDPDGTRTRVAGVKGRSPRPLDDGARKRMKPAR